MPAKAGIQYSAASETKNADGLEYRIPAFARVTG